MIFDLLNLLKNSALYHRGVIFCLLWSEKHTHLLWIVVEKVKNLSLACLDCKIWFSSLLQQTWSCVCVSFWNKIKINFLSFDLNISLTNSPFIADNVCFSPLRSLSKCDSSMTKIQNSCFSLWNSCPDLRPLNLPWKLTFILQKMC